MVELEAERQIMTEGLTESQKQHGAALDARDEQRARAEKAEAEVARLRTLADAVSAWDQRGTTHWSTA